MCAVWISGFLDVWMSGFLDFWISGFLDFRMSGHLDFWMSGFLDFWFSGCLDVWISGFLDFIMYIYICIYIYIYVCVYAYMNLLWTETHGFQLSCVCMCACMRILFELRIVGFTCTMCACVHICESSLNWDPWVSVELCVHTCMYASLLRTETRRFQLSRLLLATTWASFGDCFITSDNM